MKDLTPIYPEDAEALVGDMRGEWGRGRVKNEKARRAGARWALG